MAPRAPSHYARGPMKPPPPPRPSRPGVAGAALYILWTALVVAAPLAAAWVASSLAAHAGWSARAAAASGLLVFPALPVAWESFAAWRRRKKPPARRFLTLTDRLVLRTLAVSLVFIGGLLAADPERAFVALNGRGDWMLDGRHDARAESARRALFWTAARFQWLHRLVDRNPFREGEHAAARPRPLPTRDVAIEVRPTPDRPTPPPTDDRPTPPPAPEAPATPPRDPGAWPWDATLHPAVAALPAAVETSPEAVGRHLASVERDPLRLARAVHDYVADRVAYDVESYRSGRYPPQDAETTFRTRKSVCAGYAALFEAIGRAAGLTVETVVGRARGVVDGMGEGHAWSAVKLDNRWHLLDATWDAGTVGPDGFHKRFGTRYFLTPPEVFVARHFPDDARWQLLDAPRSAGDFLRAPALDPDFFAYGLRLVSPDRAESDARGEVAVTVDNPRRTSLMVTVRPDGAASAPCEVTGDVVVTARCPLRGADLHEVVIFAAERRFTTHWSVGALKVHNR